MLFTLVHHPDNESQTLDETEQDPEVTPGLFQGDMALTNEVGLITKHVRKINLND